MSEYINLAVPFFSQRENTYTWYLTDKNSGLHIGTGISMACQSCNITSLCMILQYLGITDDSPDDVMKKIYEIDFKSWSHNTDYRTYIEVAEHLKDVLKKTYSINDDKIQLYSSSSTKLRYSDIKKYLKQGFPIWFSWGIISGKTSGHISVIRGITETGDIIVNDPWGDPTDAYGDVKFGGKRYYTTSTNTSDLDLMGLGQGDNLVIKKSDFMKVLKSDTVSGLPKEDENKYCHQALVITENRMWSDPLRKLEKNKEFTDEEILKYLQTNESFISNNKKGNYVYAGFPLCQNGLWHNGLHLFGAEGTPVYSIGPGRIVAIRNTKDVKTNFVLVRYMDFKTHKPFFGLYKNLQYIDIKNRIKEKYSFTLGLNKVIQKEASDWLDQIIKHIMPKKALVYSEINPDGASGKESYSVTVYDKNFNETEITLKDRALVFLCPKDENQKNLLEDFSGTNQNLGSIKSFIIKNDTYTITKNDKKYYKIFAKKKENSEYIWEEGYVRTSKVYPQKFNLKEYIYYRDKLNALLNEETVIFNDEDFDYKISRAQKRKYQDVLIEEIKKIFKYAISQKNLSNENNHLNLIDGIGNYYLETIQNMKKQNEYPHLQNVINSFEQKIYNCSNIIFNYDLYLIDDPFTSEDKWLIKGTSSFEKNYKKVCTEAFSEKVSNERWKMLYTTIRNCIRRNVDYYLECNNIVPLGKIGLTEDKTYLHLELFSEGLIFKNKDYKILEEKKFDNFENKSKSLKQLKKNFDFNDSFISQTDFLNFYKNNRYKLIKTIANIINLNIKFDNEKKIKSDKHKGYTITEIDNSAFIDKNDSKSIGFSKNVSYFYHPIDFINYLNKTEK